MSIYKKLNLKNLLILLFVCSSMSISAQRIINLNNEDADVNLRRTTAVIPQEFLEEAKASRSFAINPALQNAENVSIGDFIALQLFEENNYTATVSNTITDVNGNFTLTLKLPDYPMSFAIITTNAEGKSLVNVSIPELGRSFGSRYNINTRGFYLIEVDESKLPIFTCGTCESGTCTSHSLIPQAIEINAIEIEEDGENTQNPPQSRAVQSVNCGPVAFANPNTPATIDVLIVYTPATVTSASVTSVGGINNYIANMITVANTAFSNSNTGITLRLAHSTQVTYTEPVPHNMGVTLGRLQNPTDGHMDGVHALRRQHNADLVSLITVENDVGGIAYLINTPAGSLEWGFSVVGVISAAGTNQTFAHEIGHNMGLGHAAQQTSVRAEGIFGYSFGWRFQGNVNNPWGNRFYNTVMAYQGGQFYTGAADGQGLISATIPFFSSPSISHLGAIIGNTTQADASRSLREKKHVVAFYSDKLSNLPDAPTNIVVSTPTNNGATFTWDAVPNASHYSFTFSANDGWRWFPTVNTNSITFNFSDFLSPCTTYEFFVDAVNECGDRVSSQRLTFRTRCATDPTVATLAANGITHNSATLNRTVAPASGTPIITQGFRYKSLSDNNWSTSTNGVLTGLTPNTQYRFHAFATTSHGTFNGNVLTFTTSQTPTPPTVTTQAATNITQTTATLNRTVTQGSQTVTSQGFEYRIQGATSWLTTANNNLTGLTPNTNYEFRAFATTASGTTYGSILTFRTLHAPPTVTTQAATNITQTTATLNRTVTAGTETITAQGFEYRIQGATSWLTTTNNNLTGLTPNTNYEFRAFATTASGTTYGSILTFETLAHIPPTVATQAAADINCNSATLHKLVTAGTETITVQGFEYRISGETDWQISANGELSGLTENAVYQFRAYATTASGTVRGNELTFTPTATQTQTIDFPKIDTKILNSANVTLPEKTSADLIISYQSSNEAVATISGNILTIVGVGNSEITATQSGDCDYMPATEVTRTLTVLRTAVGINNVLANQLQIFPNPAQSELFIQSELQINRVEIYSTTGALMMEENNFAEKISVSALPRGIYLLKVHTDNGLIVSKFVKE